MEKWRIRGFNKGTHSASKGSAILVRINQTVLRGGGEGGGKGGEEGGGEGGEGGEGEELDPAILEEAVEGGGDDTTDLSDFLIIVGADTGALFAYDMEGQVAWATATWPSANGIHGTPCLIRDLVVVGAYDGALYAYVETREREA